MPAVSLQAQMETDASVVARIRAGDRDAYRLLVERHSRSVYRLGYRMTGNATEAEDVVQETFLRAYRQLHRFDDTAQFSTWLYRIASNYCVDLLRARKRVVTLSPAAAGEEAPVPEVRASGPMPDRLAESRQTRERIEEAMGELTAQERLAFVMRHCDGNSIEEIAGVLGVNGNAAKHSIFRAVQKLRRTLQPLLGVAR